MELIIILIFGAAISGFVGMVIGSLGDKKNGYVGCVLGALLGPIGWIITAVLPPDTSSGSPAPAKLATTAKQLEIAKLEAQLAALKSASTKPGSVLPDDGIPTYNLD